MIISIAVVSFLCLYLLISKFVLQRKLSVVELNLVSIKAQMQEIEFRQQEKLTQDQVEFRDRIKAQYALLFEEVQRNMQSALTNSKSEALVSVEKTRAEFDQKLKTEFDKACEGIKFDEIEYKKTITKKRKEYSRKNAHKAKPKRIWRSIDEE